MNKSKGYRAFLFTMTSFWDERAKLYQRLGDVGREVAALNHANRLFRDVMQ
jgi:hypothetical protein